MKTPKSSGENDSNTDDDTEATKGGADIAADELLKADHRKVEALFSRYASAKSSGEKVKLAKQVCEELSTHTRLEEEIFYPACRAHGVEHADLDEAQVEHDEAKILIAELANGEPGDEHYDAKLTVLSEYIKHHIGEEEEPSKGIFAKARDGGLDMADIGRKLQARKIQLQAEEQEDLRRPDFPSFQLQLPSQGGAGGGRSRPAALSATGTAGSRVTISVAAADIATMMTIGVGRGRAKVTAMNTVAS